MKLLSWSLRELRSLHCMRTVASPKLSSCPVFIQSRTKAFDSVDLLNSYLCPLSLATSPALVQRWKKTGHELNCHALRMNHIYWPFFARTAHPCSQDADEDAIVETGPHSSCLPLTLLDILPPVVSDVHLFKHPWCPQLVPIETSKHLSKILYILGCNILKYKFMSTLNSFLPTVYEFGHS